MKLWMPGAVALPSTRDGGSMIGTGSRATWHTFEAPYSLTALSGARSLIRASNEVHLVFNPISGARVNLLPANRAGRGLVNKPGGVETNRKGAVNIQVEVIGYARNPWTRDLTAAGLVGLKSILAWMDSLGIPRIAPAGPSPATSAGPFPRSTALWALNGHFAHSQMPENFHWDHGGADWAIILGNTLPVVIPPVTPKPIPSPTNKVRSAPTPYYPFPLGRGQYFGPKDGPAASVSGYYSHRSDLKHLQDQLRKRGWHIGVDGLYGGETYRIFKAFQQDQHIGADGLGGAVTWQAAFRNPLT